MSFTCRQLEENEFVLIPDLYQRTWHKKRSQQQQKWIESNPLGKPLYWGAFDKDQLISLTGIMPWYLGNPENFTKAWQLGEVMTDSKYRGQGLFKGIIKIIENDLKKSPLVDPLYTLPNLASAPGLRQSTLFEKEDSIPQHILWLKASASPLQKLGPFTGLFSFLLPSVTHSKTEKKVEEKNSFDFLSSLSLETRKFLNWLFKESPKPWTIWSTDQDSFVWRIKETSLQIGLWPQSNEVKKQMLSELISVGREKGCGKIEWTGQATENFEIWLQQTGFRSTFLGRSTWRHVLLKPKDEHSLYSRLQFDT